MKKTILLAFLLIIAGIPLMSAENAVAVVPQTTYEPNYVNLIYANVAVHTWENGKSVYTTHQNIHVNDTININGTSGQTWISSAMFTYFGNTSYLSHDPERFWINSVGLYYPNGYVDLMDWNPDFRSNIDLSYFFTYQMIASYETTFNLNQSGTYYLVLNADVIESDQLHYDYYTAIKITFNSYAPPLSNGGSVTTNGALIGIGIALGVSVIFAPLVITIRYKSSDEGHGKLLFFGFIYMIAGGWLALSLLIA